jgi:hypothetical protein
LLTGLFCGLLYLFAAPSSLRLLFTLLFLLLGPGMSLVPLLGISGWTNELMLGITLSLTLDTLLGAAALYAGSWNPSGVLGALIGLSWLGVAMQVWQARHAPRPRPAARQERV